MQIQLIETNKILPYINNPRKNLNIDKVASSIKEFGFQQPIVVDKEFVIIVGHTRLEAAKKLGLKEVPVQIADLDENKAKAYRIADNRLNQDADWDNELLGVELNNLLSKDFNLEPIGFNEDELNDILFEEKEGLIDEDEVPELDGELEEPITKLGDIWKLGNHRVMCGDSTNEEYYKKLLEDIKPNMVFTDPPYGLNYEYNSHKDKDGEEYLEFCNSWFTLLQKNSEFIFLTAGWKYNKFWLMKEPNDIFYWISKNKQSGGKLSYFRKVEPIFLWGKPKKKYNLDYFDYNSDRGDGFRELHTCPKPVKFVTEAISVLDVNDIVLDVFLGSGTTIIACEKTNRICYGIEKDPKYCDLIIKRWEQFTGQKAELDKQS